MMRQLGYLLIVMVMAVSAACSSSEDEPKLPTPEETQSPEGNSQDLPDADNENAGEVNNTADDKNTEESFLTEEEFQQSVVGKYWYYEDISKHYANGDVYTEDNTVTGNYGLLALYIAPEGYLREYQAFSYKYSQNEPYQYDEKTGILTVPNTVYGYYKIHKVENGKLYVSYCYDKTINDGALNKYVTGSYTYAIFTTATTQQLNQLSLYTER